MNNAIFNSNPVLPEGCTLEKAAKIGQLEGVKCLMEKQGLRPSSYKQAIMEAAINGHFEVLKYLMEFKGESFAEGKLLQKIGGAWCAEMAINDAIAYGHCEVVKYLLQQRLGKFPKALSRAVWVENFDMVRYLVEQMADITRIKKGAFDKAAHSAVLKGNCEILKYLVQHGASLNTMYETGTYTPTENLLGIACRLNKFDIVKFLVGQGVDIHIQRDQAICNAASSDNMDMVKFLIGQGADIHAQDDQALYNAVVNGNVDMVKFLVEQGANIHAQEERALIRACRLDILEIAEYLVAQGAVISAQNDQALTQACRQENLLLVKFLVIQETRSIL
jgi:ankyrin repeat protein